MEIYELKDETLLEIAKSYTIYIVLIVLCLLQFFIVTLHHSKQVSLGLIVAIVTTFEWAEMKIT